MIGGLKVYSPEDLKELTERYRPFVPTPIHYQKVERPLLQLTIIIKQEMKRN